MDKNSKELLVISKIIPYWLKDIPYKETIVYGKNWKEGGILREYPPKYESVLKKFSKCDVVKNFFGTVRVFNHVNMINGHPLNIEPMSYNYYPSNPDVVIPDPSLGENCKGISIGRAMIATLICCKLYYNSVYEALHNSLDTCTSVGRRISSSLVRNATSRIFDDPHQSILELVTNALDSYGDSGTKVGKFGMGFFSFLYWLIGDPQAYILIESTSGEGKDLCSFICVIQEVNSVITFSVDFVKSQNTTTGTIVSLIPGRKSLNFDKFMEQLGKLHYYSKRIISINGNKHFNISVYIDVDVNRGIKIVDFGKGITPDILYNYLLVPSVSTKTISLTTQVYNYNPQSKLYKGRTNRLDITVAYIIIISIEIESLDYQKEDKQIFMLDLPPFTRLPVARNDVILEEKILPYLETSLEMLYSEAFNKVHDILVLTKLIEKYTQKTQSSENASIITSINRKILEKFDNIPTYIPVSYDNIDNFLYLQNYILKTYRVDIKVYISNIERRDKFESAIIEAFGNDVNRDLIIGKTVCYMNDVEKFKYVNIQLLGCSTLVFMLRDIPLEKLGELSILVPDDKLVLNDGIPLNYEKLLLDTNPNVDKNFIRNISDDLKVECFPILYNIYLRMISLKTYFNVQTFPKNMFSPLLSFMILEKYNILSAVECKNILYNYYNYLGELFPIASQVDYGGQKRKLNITYAIGYSANILSLFGNVDDPAFRKKFNRFYKDYNILANRNMIIYLQRKYYSSFLFSDYDLLFFVYCDLQCPKGLITNIFELSRNVQDFVFLFIYINYVSKRYKNININEELVRIYCNIIKTYISQDEIDKKIYYYGFYISHSPDISVENTVAMLLFFELAKTLNSGKLLTDYKLTNIQTYKYQFRLSNLIDLVFREEVPTLSELFTKASTNTNKLPLQIVEIAINEGSIKDVYLSVLTELVQNSIDAIRSTKSKGIVKIDFSEYENNFVLSVTDFVGIPENSLLALMIPYYSQKVPSPTTTGEMGNGFFNSYRSSSKVVISTVKDGKSTVIVDNVIREQNRAIDLDKKIFINKSKAQNGTKIDVFFDKMSAEKLEYELAVLNRFIINTLALTEGVNIELNGNIVSHIKKELMADTNFFKVYILDSETVPSFVFTKGIPFMELSTFLIQVLGIDVSLLIEESMYSIMIDLKDGSYLPVQSRSALQLDREVRNILTDYIVRATYVAVINKINTNPNKFANTYITNFFSTASLNQLRVNHWMCGTYKYINNSSYNSKSYIIYYAWFPTSQFFDLVNNIADKKDKYAKVQVVKEKLDSYIQTYLTQRSHILKKSLDNNFITNFNYKLRNLLSLYITPKLVTEIATKKEQIIIQTKAKKVVLKNEEKFLEIVSKFIDSYWNLGKKLKINGFIDNPPKLEIKELPISILGQYTSSRTIELNSERLPTKLLPFIKGYPNLSKVKVTKFYQNYLEFSPVPETIIHELEHARRRNSHDNSSGAHEEIPNFLNENMRPSNYRSKILSFNECASAVHLVLLNNGLTDMWLK